MKSSNKDIHKIQKDFDTLFEFKSDAEKVEAGAQLLMAKFLSKIQDITDEKNMTRKELAELIGTSPSYLTQLYRGHKNLNFLTLAKLQIALNIEFEVSLKGESKNVSDLSKSEIVSNYPVGGYQIPSIFKTQFLEEEKEKLKTRKEKK